MAKTTTTSARRPAKATEAKPPEPSVPFTCRPHPHLYEINTWAWLDQLSRKLGRNIQLQDVPDSEWDRLRELGFDLVYLMGMWRRSLAGRRVFRTSPANYAEWDRALPGWTMDNVVGSPYSIQDYSPDPRIGDWKQLDALRAKLHARGMGLVLDFVPNHTGFDHAWVTSHPEYYVQGNWTQFRQEPGAFYVVERDFGPPLFVACGRDPYFAPWADVAQLNYFNPEARAALIQLLRNLSQHCDGLRCDMAMLVLNEIFTMTWGRLLGGTPAPPREFWPEAIESVPGLIWMAEVYWDLEPRLQQLGFTYTYDKRLYDRMHQSPPREVNLHLAAGIGYQSHMARFLENHDEPRAAAVFGKHRLPAAATVIATLPGLRFFHEGQFEGRTIHLSMPLNSAADEPVDRELVEMYERVLRLGNEAVYHGGEWKRLDVKPDSDGSWENLIAYRWRSEVGYRLIIVNLSSVTSQGRVYVAEELPPAGQYVFSDKLSGQDYVRDRDDIAARGLYVRLDPYRAHVFSVAARQAAGA